jgi:multicomponent Na+:H+ antiporter subunit E
MILNEAFGWIQLVTGLILALVILIFTNTQLLLNGYCSIYRIRIFALIRYFFVLIIQVYKSGFAAIVRVIRGDDSIRLMQYSSYLQDDLSIGLLANAITLTPGTVTLDVEDQQLQILCFNQPGTTDNHAQKEAIARIEKILREPSR